MVGILFQTLLLHAPHIIMSTLVTLGGIAIIIFGILLIASSKYIIPFFSTEHKIRFRRLRNSYISSFLFGVAFSIGWTPCVGAILASIYLLAAASPGIGFLLLLAYSLGLGIPFLVFGFFISRLSGFLHKVGNILRYFNIIGGTLLVVLGLLVVTGYIGLLAVFLIGSGGTASLNDQLNFLIAIFAGLLTFFSPCILPLLPAYLSYMAGTTAEGARR